MKTAAGSPRRPLAAMSRPAGPRLLSGQPCGWFGVVVGCELIGVCEPAGESLIVSPVGPAEPDCVVGEVEVGERRDRLDRVVDRLVLGVPVDIVEPVVPP